MCGIFCLIKSSVSSNIEDVPEWELCKNAIANRGPDSLLCLEKSISKQWLSQFCASVLWTQGPQPTSQPLIDSDSNVLLWNGDVFSGSVFQQNVCDSNVISAALQSSTDVYRSLKQIKGPFSFAYYQRSSNLLYFARDRFGRHSLLFKISEKGDSLLLTSAAVKDLRDLVELPAIGLFVADLNHEQIKIKCVPWFEPNERRLKVLEDLGKHFNVQVDLVESVEYLPDVEHLSLDVKLECEIGLSKYVGITNEYKSFDEAMDRLLENSKVREIVNNLSTLLNDSVLRRVKTIPSFCRSCTKSGLELAQPCPHAKVGLLFSGGLDSAILAVITDAHVDGHETIDLINVAFDKKNNGDYEVPDRKTGRQTYRELLKLCPNRQFNFVEVDVSQEELQRYRATRISNLAYPLATVLDDSLACAVWFAGRARGKLHDSPDAEPYESSCRVLLLGMGADEQFGGYARHRTILKRNGWNALAAELRLEFDRISDRNLGRDDRMVADHGRQSRLPYLDEDLVDFVQKLPPWQRCCPTDQLPAGLGDKLLLRLLARKIGLRSASKLPKRAFQFGSRIANGKENAKDLSKRL